MSLTWYRKTIGLLSPATRRGQRPQSRRRCFRPALEILEDRQLLTATWLPQGPSPSSIMGGTLGIAGNQTAGAVTGIAIDPNNSSHVIIGTSDGGIWTT